MVEQALGPITSSLMLVSNLDYFAIWAMIEPGVVYWLHQRRILYSVTLCPANCLASDVEFFHSLEISSDTIHNQ